MQKLQMERFNFTNLNGVEVKEKYQFKVQYTGLVLTDVTTWTSIGPGRSSEKQRKKLRSRF
jgi:hypothetical protein